MPPVDSHAPRLAESYALAPDGTRIFYEQSGDGPVVVLCDGIACDGFIWKYLRVPLLARCRVLHWHYRGHGRSAAPRDPLAVGVEDHARDLWCVLDHAGIDRAALVGHSMGTQVCLEAWHQHPERVRALGLVCGSYGRITRTFHNSDVLVHVLPRAIALIEAHPVIARTLWASGPSGLLVYLARMLGEVDALRTRTEDMVPYFEHVARLDPAMFFRMVLRAGEHTAEHFLNAIDVPTLIVAAERDSFTPVRYAEQMLRQIPAAEILRVPGGTHSAPLEQPALIEGAMLRFLDRVGS
jgi:pimeloyl-ACP methyl ester carboxylesterase